MPLNLSKNSYLLVSVKCKCAILRVLFCIQSKDFTITSLVMELTHVRSHLSGRIPCCNTWRKQLLCHSLISFSVPPGTHYSWVGQGSVECKACPTLLHMTSDPLVTCFHMCIPQFMVREGRDPTTFHTVVGVVIRTNHSATGECSADIA